MNLEQKITSMEVAEMATPKVVYLLLATDNSVKVGVTGNFEKRLKVIENQSGKEITTAYVTKYCSNSYEIETDFKRHFKDKKLKGEWYSINFDEAKEYLEKNFELKEKRLTSNKENTGIDKLLDFIFEGRA